VTDRRRLIVMRHAKAEPFASTDHERRLTDRGRAGAQAAGRWLREEGLVPDHVVVSSAVRARETWEAVADVAGFETSLATFDEGVFNGGPRVVLDVLQGLPEDAATVLFIGHNPTAAYLCHFLDDGEGDPEATSGMLRGFPPGAVAVLEIRTAWSEVGPETGRLVRYVADADD
jgi:phosphohistidine phosphatase